MDKSFEEKLRNYIQSELESSLDLIKENKLQIEIPNPTDVDLTIEQLASLVAESSNKFGAAARLAGIARAEAKLSKGAYEKSFKKNASAAHLKNDKARTAYAMEQSQEEHSQYILAEAIATIADSIESGARVGSESARKLYDRAFNIMVANGRAEHAQPMVEQKDTSPW